MASMVKSLYRGRGASSSVSVSVGVVVSHLEDTWCLRKGYTDSDPAPLMFGSTSSIIMVYDVLFSLDHDRWFRFLKRPLIPTIDLVSEPPAVDVR